MGRKGGDSAFDSAPRPYSKKQIQRKATALKKKAEKKDHAKEKTKAGAVDRNMDTDATMKYLDNLSARLIVVVILLLFIR